jgi:hypothetical protein
LFLKKEEKKMTDKKDIWGLEGEKEKERIF